MSANNRFDVVDCNGICVGRNLDADSAMHAINHARFESLAYDSSDESYSYEDLAEIARQEAGGETLSETPNLDAAELFADFTANGLTVCDMQWQTKNDLAWLSCRVCIHNGEERHDNLTQDETSYITKRNSSTGESYATIYHDMIS